MKTDNPVVVYGATGYTGQLTCEELMRRQIPFVAAGRDQRKLDAMRERWLGRGASCEALAIRHDPYDLRRLLRGKKLVINITGPFSQLGRDVVYAALDAGCHYVDVTGEQDFMIDMKRAFAPLAQEKQLILLHSNAFHWAPGGCAADVVLETEGVDSVRVVYKVQGRMTIASAKSTFRVGKRPQFKIEQGALTRIDYRRGHIMVVPPNESQTIAACPLGTAEPIWFESDPRVKALEVMRADMASVQIAKSFLLFERLQRVVPREPLDWVTDTLTDRFWKTPPREDEQQTRFVVWAEGVGSQVSARCVIRGARPYLLTGFLGGEAATRIMNGEILQTGFVGTHQAFGARSILHAFKNCGTALEYRTGNFSKSGGIG